MIRLHDNLSSGNGYKVRLLLAQLDTPFERVEYDIDAGETRAPGFLQKVNPNGRVPVLELEDGTMLPESDAILFYLAENTPFLPEGRLERAQVLRWMFFEQYDRTSQNTRVEVQRPTGRGWTGPVGIGTSLKAETRCGPRFGDWTAHS